MTNSKLPFPPSRAATSKAIGLMPCAANAPSFATWTSAAPPWSPSKWPSNPIGSARRFFGTPKMKKSIPLNQKRQSTAALQNAGAKTQAQRNSARFWSAAVLCRFRTQLLGASIVVTISTLLTSHCLSADNELTSQEKNSGWLLLFDGQSLDGWMTSDQKPSRR